MARDHLRHLVGTFTALAVLGAAAPWAAAQTTTSTTSTTSTTTVPGDTASTTVVVPVGAVTSTTTVAAPSGPAPTTTSVLPPTATTTTEPRPPDHWSVAPRFAIPPDDSLAATQELLTRVIADQAALSTRRAQMQGEADALTGQLAAGRTLLADLKAKSKARAVSAFIGDGSMVESKIQVDTARVRMITMIEGVERSDADLRRRTESSMSATQVQLDAKRAELAATDADVQQLAGARKALQDKIAGAVDLTNPVPVGPTDIAMAASSAQNHRKAVVSLTAAGDAPAAAVADAEFRADLQRLATLVAGPTPGAYPIPDGSAPRSTSTGTTTSGPRPSATTTTVPGTPGTSGAASATDTPVPSADHAAEAFRLLTAWTALDDRRLGVMLFALQQVGKQYIWAAAGPNAFDCSGLTMRAWITAGVKLDHFSGSQAHQGPPAPPDQLQPTDLLTYGPNSGSHVTMYLGAGRMVEAKGSAYGIIVSDARVAGASGTTHIL